MIITDNRRQALTDEERNRYSRHLMMPEVGVLGQERLKAARALIVGAGGLGSPLGLYLAAAGVGVLGLVDYDTVDESNLQRQIIHSSEYIGKRKTASARDRINALNPLVEVEVYNTALIADNAYSIIKNYDLVADGTDNLAARRLINDACLRAGIPYVYGSVGGFSGQVSVFCAKEGPCYNCAFPAPAQSAGKAKTVGVMGVTPGIIGCIQAAEAVKLIVGCGESLIGRLLVVDALYMGFTEIKIYKAPNCPVCGKVIQR